MTNSWTTAHLAALAGYDAAFPFGPKPLDLSGQRVRQAVRLRRGGTGLRLVLSNEYGDGPLVLDEVTVGDGSQVMLAGQARWEIPAGETAMSDPVALATRADDELLINCFSGGHTPAATFLPSAQRTGEAGADTFLSLYWIARVLVDSPAAGPVVVALGDSITRGDGTTPDKSQRYPDHLQRRMLEAGIEDAAVLNAGLGANRVLRPGLGPSMLDRFARDVLSVSGATHVVIMGGANDIGLPAILGGAPPTARELTDGLFSLAAHAQEHGIRPVLGTITPFGSSDEQIRGSVNDAIRSQRDWAVADFATAIADPADQARLLPAFDSGDGLHPNDDGARALAGAIDLALFC